MPDDRGGETLGEKIARLDAWRENVGEPLRRTVDDHGKRLSTLERFQSWLVGAGMALGVIFGYAFQALKGKFWN
jgi:hypothetical protein